ncbi:MAG: hypothetical protein L0Y54_07655 [Sporichthyaceae bacterium]|nr:hypothetical protein [Sporichthyaceae bacterium]
MQPTDARTLRGAVVPTTVVGLLLAAGAAVQGGRDAAIGAGLGVLLVIGFFSASVAAVSWAAKQHDVATLPVAMFAYLFKITILAIVLAVFRDTTLFSSTAFGVAVLIATVTWLVSLVYGHVTAKILYVDPAEADDPR